MKTLSIIIPAYNEERTICTILSKIVNVEMLHGVKKDIIVINDCSSDSTKELVETYIKEHPGENIRLFNQEKNQGKGAAIRKGISHINGDIVIIQDADLEYEPEDYNLMIPYILSGEYNVVYGSRFLNSKNRHSYRSFYLGGRLVTIATNLLYWQRLTDEPTCYKMFDAQVLKNIKLNCTGFEFCPEVTAKVLKTGNKILEVPIHYYPRSIEEGKKIKWNDGVEAIWVLLKYRFVK